MAYDFFGATVPNAWSGWQSYITGPLDFDPVSIHDASQFRGRFGEVQVISNRLYGWVPQ